MAASVAVKHRTAQGLLDELNVMNGNNRSFDSLMAELFHEKKQGKDQTPCDRLNEIYGELNDLREIQSMTTDVYHNRMYMVFQKACTSSSLTCELRARFGTAEQGVPTYAGLFNSLRQVEGLDYGRARDRRPAAPTVASHQVQPTRFATPTPRANGRGGRQGKRGTIRCRQCAVLGHIMSQCPNNFDEEAVLRFFGEDGLDFYHNKIEQLSRQGNGGGHV